MVRENKPMTWRRRWNGFRKQTQLVVVQQTMSAPCRKPAILPATSSFGFTFKTISGSNRFLYDARARNYETFPGRGARAPDVSKFYEALLPPGEPPRVIKNNVCGNYSNLVKLTSVLSRNKTKHIGLK